MALLRRGLSGEPVRIMQGKLGVDQDGIFGQGTEAALIQYQKDNGLSPDGIAGPDTFTAMNLPELILLHRPLRGEQVRILQQGLGIDADGVFGGGTEKAVMAFQESNGLPVTGLADPTMLRLVPGFEHLTEETVAQSLVSDTTPDVDPGAVEEVKVSMDAPAEQEGVLASLANGVHDAASNVGKSIWNTVKSIF